MLNSTSSKKEIMDGTNDNDDGGVVVVNGAMVS